MATTLNGSSVAADGLEARITEAVKAVGDALPSKTALDQRTRFYDLLRRPTVTQHPLFTFCTDAIRSGAPLDAVLTIPLAVELWVRSYYPTDAPHYVEAWLAETWSVSDANTPQGEMIVEPSERNFRRAIQATIRQKHDTDRLIRALDRAIHTPQAVRLR